MFKIKCPSCKSTNIVFQGNVYSMSADECLDCKMLWEAPIFVRLFMPFYIVGLVILATQIPETKMVYLKSGIGLILMLGFITSIFWALIPAWFIFPYREWNEAHFARKVINYGGQAAMLICGIYYYAYHT